MKKRDTLLALVALGATPLLGRTQSPGKIPRIGVLWHAGSEQEEAIYLGALRRGLNDLGYVEGRNIVLENRYPAEQPDRFNSYAVELAQLKVDVLVAVTPAAAFAAQRATSTIPIVFLYASDPVAMKLVDSLARPGGMITGLSQQAVDISAKQVQLFKEAVPGLTRVALMARKGNPLAKVYTEEMQGAARALNLPSFQVEVSRPDDFDSVFASVARDRGNGVIALPDGMFYVERQRIADLALKRRLPVMMPWMEAVEAGSLMSYGASYRQLAYRAAYFIDRILKGSRPADLPVELASKFELIINAKTARSLGIAIPQTVLLRADEVFQ